MHRLITLVAVLLTLGFGSIASITHATAQEATPENRPAPSAAQDEAKSSSADPAVGDTVSYVDENGDEIATVTVDEVIDPFEDYDPDFGEPERGYRFVGLRVTIENTGSGTLELQSFDFSVQDDQGFLLGTAFVSRTDEQDEADPQLEDVELAEGESATGLLIFELYQDSQPVHIFWQPDSGRLITLARI